MKFGKNIGRVVELSDPEWSPFWMNYKFLKKKVKALAVEGASGTVESRSKSCPQAIAKSAGEVEFYKLLRQELRKCSLFFTSVEAQFLMRQDRVNEGWRQLQLTNIIVEGNPNRRLMAACVKLYKDLLLLENFAIMNYCGFSKILKKHDKVTGFRTRENFMRKVVNHEPFVHYPKVVKMLSSVEALFKNIESLPSSSSETGARVPLREEQLFIDTMLTINTEAFRLQQEEGADIGLNTPDFSHKGDGFSKQRSPSQQPGHSSRGLDVMAAAAAQVVSKDGLEAEGGKYRENSEKKEVTNENEEERECRKAAGRSSPTVRMVNEPCGDAYREEQASSKSRRSSGQQETREGELPPPKRVRINSD